jgi:multisubunit Na+/H+ antiporter MnhG subunit
MILQLNNNISYKKNVLYANFTIFKNYNRAHNNKKLFLLCILSFITTSNAMHFIYNANNKTCYSLTNTKKKKKSLALSFQLYFF